MKIWKIFSQFVKRLWCKKDPEQALLKEDLIVESVEGKELTKEQEKFLSENQKCPLCRAGQLLAGPCGGLAQNILCKSCGNEFNYCGAIFPTTIMGRDLKRAAEVYGIVPDVYVNREEV